MKYLTLIVLLLIFSCNELSKSETQKDLIEKSEASMVTNDYTMAIKLAKEALKLSKLEKDSISMAEALYILARSSALSGDFNNVVIYGEEGKKITKRIINYPLEYKINNTLSWAYFEEGKSFDESSEHNKRQLFVVSKLNDNEAKASVHNNYGYDATVSGSVPLTEAIQYSKFANDYYAKTENHKGRWYTLMNLTWQYRLLNDLEKSEAYGLLSAAQAEKDNDRHAIVEANTNLGETLMAQNKMNEAKLVYESALKISAQKNDRDKYVFDVYYSRYLWNSGKKKEAILLINNAINFLKNSEVFYEMLARAYLAEYYYLLGDSDKSQKQIDVFKNPRATYISQEAKIKASIIEAQLLAKNNNEEALKILNSSLNELNKSGAEYLKLKIQKIKDEL